MINKLRNLENTFSINKAAFVVAILTIASRLVGLLRDRLFASNFGAGDTLDVYYAAFRIPDFIFNLLILGTLSVAFIPVFTEWLQKDKQVANKIANTILNLSFITMLIVCSLLFIAARPLTKLLVPGFSPEKFSETILLTRFFLLSPIIFTLSSVFSSVLNANKKFLISSIAPILYNFGIIFGLLILYPKFGIEGLGFGVILGALLHLGIQAASVFANGFTWEPVLDLKNLAVKKIYKLFLPRIFGLDNSQISLLIGSVIGSSLASGSVTVFNLANNLQAVPLGVFAISISVASFPLLSENFSKNEENLFSENLLNSIIKILFFVIPISILILVLRAHIVRLAFGSGKFDWQDTILTFKTLGIFSLSIFAQALSPLLARAFYARQNTKTPVIIGLCSMAINAILAYIFAKNYGVVGIAGAFSISAILNCVSLFVAIRFKLSGFKDSLLMLQTGKILFSGIFSGISAYALLYLINPFLNTRTGAGLLIQFLTASILGTLVFLYTAYLQKLSPAVYIFKLLTRKQK